MRSLHDGHDDTTITTRMKGSVVSVAAVVFVTITVGACI